MATCCFCFPVEWLGLRHVQFFMHFLAAIVTYGVRTNMSIAIIAMIQDDYPDWTKKETILSSFYWGYVVPQICAGAVVNIFGAKWFLAATMAVNSLFTLLIPIMAASLGERGVIACRVIQGLSQGFVFPSVHGLLGKWSSRKERSRVCSFVYTAGPLGIVIALPITGAVAESSVGWPTAFYLYGAFALGWSCLWIYIGADTPEEHGGISEEERRYIEDVHFDEEKLNLPIPWKSIFTSLPFFAILVSHCGQNYGLVTLLTEIPSYLSSIMRFKLASNSLLSALPYMVLWILGFVFSNVADYLIVKKYLSVGNARKLCNTIGLIIPAIALVGLSFVTETQKKLAVVLLVIAVGFNAGVYSGFNVNHIDLSRNHAAILMGITNCFSNCCSSIAPLVVHAIPYKQTDLTLWRYVFCITAGIYTVTAVFYIVFASGDTQPWDHLSKNLEGERL